MTRRPFVSRSLVAAAAFAGPLWAAETKPAVEPRPAVLKDATPFVVPNGASSARAPSRPRSISPELAAQLTALHPKFESLAPVPKPDQPPAEPAETDKPRNRIIRLPSYLVQEDRPLPFKERELRTPKERLDLAYRKNPGLRLGNIGPFRNDGIAMFMQYEEERLERMKEMADLVSLLTIAGQNEVKPVIEQTFIRQPDLR